MHTKHFFARYADIKTGKLELIDEDGTVETLSDVEQSLKNVGINIRTTITDFDNAGDSLNSLAEKWDSLNSTQQNAIAKAFGGIRQKVSPKADYKISVLFTLFVPHIVFLFTRRVQACYIYPRL